MKTVSIVLPCYNEEESLPLYFKAVDPILATIKDYQVGFVLVNDGSKDKTLEVMEKLYQTRNDITIVNEAKNYGQNPAFTAGLEQAKGDYVITMDSDLQDPVELIPQILAKFSEGYDVVNPHRSSRKTDTGFKRYSAGLFYKFLNKIEHKQFVPENVNCFRGLSRKAVDSLNSLPESDRYYVGLVPFVGLKTATIDFARQEREAGKSKYNSLSKLFMYAFNITSSSTARPLYFPLKFGLITSCFFGFSSLVLLVLYILGQCQVMTSYPQITLWMVISFVALGFAIVIDMIGLVSLYLHSILINTRQRPDHLVDFVKRPEDKAGNNQGKEENHVR
ncbi:MAG: glycosyltransferase family 2 protein [Bacilli bacterium]|jgi:glycosyltransferase involved in cell wall biosynthesis|nr:glycosyltransferase family 2 protein [Bacilli bacterium]